METKKIINATSRKYECELRTSVAEMLRSRGMSNSEIANVLGVTYQTVHRYIGAQPSRSFGGCYKKPKAQTKSNSEKNLKSNSTVNSEKISVFSGKKKVSREDKMDALIESIGELIRILKAEKESNIRALP